MSPIFSRWSLTMKNTHVLTLVVAIIVSVPTASPQTGSHHFPTPPESMDPQHAKQSPPSLTRHVDFAEVEREADDLARTAQTVPADVANIRKGMLPKDALEKLKQIEKLSKRLRGELSQ
jgi:hypothetical protein